MSVVRNRDYWFYEWKIGGKTVRRSSGYRVDQATREQVRELEEDVKRRVLEELGKGTAQTPASITLEQAIDRFYAEKWSRDRVGDKQLKNALLAATVIGRHKPLDEITSKDLARLKAHLLEKGRARTTVNRYLSSIMVILNHAAKYWQVLDRVPAVKREDETGTERLRVVSWEEERLILQACVDLGEHDFKDLYIVLVDAGLRRGEALRMTYSRNIDLHTGLITIYGDQHKNRRPKSIPMTERVREVLTRRQELGDKPFGTFTLDVPLKRLQKVLKAAGLPEVDDIVLHSLRHTFAARLANTGVPIYEVSKLLGHTSVKTTERYYAHLFVDTLRSSISVLDQELAKRQ